MNTLVSTHKLFLTITEAAYQVGICRSMAYLLIRSGEWRVVKIGKCARISYQFLSEWAAAKERVGRAA